MTENRAVALTFVIALIATVLPLAILPALQVDDSITALVCVLIFIVGADALSWVGERYSRKNEGR